MLMAERKDAFLSADKVSTVLFGYCRHDFKRRTVVTTVELTLNSECSSAETTVSEV